VETVGDVVRGLGARKLAQVGGVEHQHEGAARPRIEDDREQNALVLRPSSERLDEDGLAGAAALLGPFGRRAALDVGLDDPVEPARLRVDPPDVAVEALVVRL